MQSKWVGQWSVVAVFFAALLIISSYLLLPLVPLPWRTAGSSELYLMGVLGAVLLLMPGVYALVKRSDNKAPPRTWLIAHIVMGVSGVIVVTIHAAGGWSRPPAILLFLAYLLILQGAWARSVGSAKLARVMSSRSSALRSERPVDKDALRRILADKTSLLAQLDPSADEATFSPGLGHWIRHPILAYAYVRMAHAEAMIIGARATVSRDLGNWRRVHLLMAAMLVGGIVVHVITVTFFAGYVADGGPITWWHLAAWGD